MEIKDAFGNILKPGDKIAWIGSPSGWCKEIRKGTLLRIYSGDYGRPSLAVRADKNDYSHYNKEAYRESILVVCRDISGPGQKKTYFMFPRVIKL